MADQVTGIAGGVTGQGLGGLTGALQGSINNLVDVGSGWIDNWFPPERREQLKAKLMKFATERPQLAAFLLSNIAISGPALALFLIMSLTVLVFALLAGILVGVIGALLFTVFCLGVALLVLLPTLFFTTFAASFIFLWGLGAYYIIKWFNQKEVPGIHTDLKGGLQKQMGLDNFPALNGELPKAPPRQEKDSNANAHPKQQHGEDKENTPPTGTRQPAANKRSQTPKATRADIPGGNQVKKSVGGVTSGIGLT